MIRTVAAALVFFGAIGWWGSARLISAGAGSVPVTPSPTSQIVAAAPGGTVQPAAPAVGATAANPGLPSASGPTAQTAAPAAADKGTEPGAAGAAKQPGAPAPTTAPASTSPPAPTAPPALTDDQQIALQQQLEALGKSYLKALQANDTATISAMLAGRCAGADVTALVVRRRAEVSADAGTAIEQITPLNQFVGHFDPAAGEAHTVLQWSFNGQRGQTTGADGWLLEGGVWKSAVC